MNPTPETSRSKRWQQIESMYQSAQVLDPARRVAFLDQACAGDEELRREVESLLRHEPDDGKFHTAAAFEIAAPVLAQDAAQSFLGREIGSYKILSLLGVGGMGEVYRAKDLKLGRDVAIKVLPASVESNPERLSRFEREARLLAALNHPHIAAIYGFERSMGTSALVLEMVEGITLAERLDRGPIPLVEALKLALQIADALEAAHEKGIIHRDLKPANIKVTPDGKIKVLDFGLAKAFRGEGTDHDPSQLPTVTIDGTREGVIAGTPLYMSPEQAQGNPVDKRTDIWAFGCVLYEMVTGRPVFRGKTAAEILARVITADPDWTALPGATPVPIRHLLRQSLVKDSRKRLRDIGDARIAIETALSDAEKPAPAEIKTSRRRHVWQVAAVVAIAAIAGLVWQRIPHSPSASPTIGPLTRLTSDSGFTTDPSISADGRLVVYASDRSGDGNLDLWVQQTTGGSAIRLTTDPADDHQPDVSPDGSQIAFRSERSSGGIYVVPALGGEARLIAPEGMAPRFSPDGRSIAFWTGQWLAPRSIGNVRKTYILPAGGGEPTEVAATLASTGDPIWSPDGRALLVFGRQATSGAATDPDWWWIPRDGGTVVRTGAYDRFRARGIEIVNTDFQPYPGRWTDNGVLFAARTANAETASIWTVPIDPLNGRVTGDPVQLTSGTTADNSPSVSHDGRLVFAALTVHDFPFALTMDANSGRASGTLRRLRDDTAASGRSGISDDGNLLVFPRYEFGAGGVWIRDLRTGRERQLAAAPWTPLNPIISLDGRWVAYTVTTVDMGGNAGPGVGYVIEANGGVPRKVCDECEVHQWTRDDHHVVILEKNYKAISIVNIESGARVSVITSDEERFSRPVIAPNERWIMFGTAQRISLAPLYSDRNSPEREWTVLVSTKGAERPAGWSPDGKLAYLLLERDGFRCLYALRIDAAVGRPVGEPFPVYHFHHASQQWGSTGLGSAVVNSLFLSHLSEFSGNVWMTTLKQ
jgi:eukaryotic-like serine/threonine-protein kinase